jgi:bla regulator protein BlaR1
MKKVGRVLKIRRKLLLAAAGSLALVTLTLFGSASATSGRMSLQSQDAGMIKFEFESVSIKPNQSGAALGTISPVKSMMLNGGILASNATLMDLIRAAYGIEAAPGVEDGRVVGAPSWTTSERYDVDAKIDRPVADALWKLKQEPRTLQSQQMLQALLAERFKLTVHRDSKELPVYVLSVAKNGPKFREANPADTYKKGATLPTGMPSGPGTAGREANGRLVFQGTAISELVALLPQLDRTVVDKTGLTEKYDFTFMPPTQKHAQASADFNIGPLSDALQNQLGLKLEAMKSRLGIIVIDHVERPSEN